MVQRNGNGLAKVHEILPHRQINPVIYDMSSKNSTTLATKIISKIENRIQQRSKYGNRFVADYFEFKFSEDRDKIRIEPSITQNDFERILVDEVELIGRENISTEIFVYYKYNNNKNKINGSKDEVQPGISTSPTYTNTTTIPYSSTQMNFEPSHTKESALADVPEPDILDKDSDKESRMRGSASKKSFYFEKDEKADTLLYDNTMSSESSEDKKNLCNTNSVETVESNLVGLVNQAMTCYLNSLLQALFMTPEFRNALYKWEYKNNEKDSEANSIPYQLQRLFLNLQTSHKASIETTSLTKSFGWDVSDSWHQHDIQELCRVMFDALEQKFKNTAQADLINRLYEGKINDYVKCLSCNTEKSREDTFLDIPLPVRPFDNNEAYGSVEEALEAFVKYETLEGSNQYFCEKCDKKSDAHKGLKFTKFPYILTLQLKRFDFDHNTYNRIKLNDKVTFPEFLNLNSFIEPTANGESHSCKEEIVENNTSDENSVTDVNDTDKSCVSNDTLISNSNHLNNHGKDDDEGITMENGSSCSSHNENVEKLRKEYASAKGPYIYELFSIMIHSGSASGGHYYAYIKDFRTNKWYCFNDQMVSSITEEEIKKTYGGGTRTVYYSGVYRSSTNAYMLMYRQIDPERNTLPMETKEFPPHIKKLLEKMKSEEEQSYRDEQISMERRFKQTIYYRDSHSGEIDKNEISISMGYTLNQVVEAALKKFFLEYKFETSQCRIVTYFPEYDLIDATYEGQEDQRLDYLFSSQHMIRPLLLDVRSQNETFQNYPSDPIITKVYVIDAIDKDLVFCPKYVRAHCKQTVREYKQELLKHFSLDLDTLQLYSPEILPNRLLQDELVFDSLSTNHVYTISTTDSYNEDMTNNFLGSTFYKMHEHLSDVITFYIDRKDVTKERLDNLSIPSLTEHNRDVKKDEDITNVTNYDYNSKDLAHLNTNSNNTYHYKSVTDVKSRIETENNTSYHYENQEKNNKTEGLYNLNWRSKEEKENMDLAEKRDYKIDDMCPKLKCALNEIETNQSNKEKYSQEESDKEVQTSQSVSNQHIVVEDKKKKFLGNNNNNNNALSVREPYRNERGNSRPLHELDNKEKNEEYSTQETSNSEDSSLSDSDRTLVGDAPEEFNYDRYDNCPIAMDTGNKDSNYEKFFKIEPLRRQDLLKVSMDIQTSEEELKKKLESYLDIPRGYFKIVDYYTSHLDEINSITYNSSDRLVFREDKKYSINLERILNPDEGQITVYILEMDSSSKDILGKLFTTIVKKNTSIGSMKKQVINELKHKPYQELSCLSSIPYEKWRFMEIENDTVGKVLEDKEDDKILPELMREICIQQIPRVRETSTRIYAIKWNPSKTLLMRWPREEIEIDKNEEFGEQIKKKISETSQISEENLEFYPLVATKDIDTNKIESAEWKSHIRADELDFKTHLLYRDSTDKSISLTDSSSSDKFEGSQVRYRSTRLKTRGLDPVPVSSSPRKEKALKIRVGST